MNLAGGMVLFALFCIVLVLLAKCLAGDHQRFSGFDTRLLWVPAGAGLAWALVAITSRKANRTLALAVMLLSVVLAAAVAVLDHYNVVITYGKWLERGCPDEWSRAASPAPQPEQGEALLPDPARGIDIIKRL
ncbi:hypothetical protein JW921_00510 [Candidatus Fermentibacterales bacterium]|nr:hypothetical protein [Candidatus Fermentibacterales bacterium]